MLASATEIKLGSDTAQATAVSNISLMTDSLRKNSVGVKREPVSTSKLAVFFMNYSYVSINYYYYSVALQS
jgi:hypothetical protein